ncbi:unnamed protein product [Caenorhabditis angaria]|uniref:DUF38 domain-containing protein n=1 Tax=Caenorhabditis angaria TaxID=860376 RepID=A0A9P1IEK3_9PELO|nr:unnamed protein product [Caenorhabditis angaria]
MKIFIIFSLLFQIISAEYWLTEIEAEHIGETLLLDVMEGVPSVEKFRQIFHDPFLNENVSRSIDYLVGEIRRSRKEEFEKTNHEILDDNNPIELVEASILNDIDSRKAIVYRVLRKFDKEKFENTFDQADAEWYDNWVQENGGEELKISDREIKAYDSFFEKPEIEENSLNFTIVDKKTLTKYRIAGFGKNLLLVSETSVAGK